MCVLGVCVFVLCVCACVLCVCVCVLCICVCVLCACMCVYGLLPSLCKGNVVCMEACLCAFGPRCVYGRVFVCSLCVC